MTTWLQRALTRWRLRRGQAALVADGALALVVDPCASCGVPWHDCWPCPNCGRVQPCYAAHPPVPPPDLELYKPIYIKGWAFERGGDGSVYVCTVRAPGPVGIVVTAEVWAQIVAHVSAPGDSPAGRVAAAALHMAGTPTQRQQEATDE